MSNLQQTGIPFGALKIMFVKKEKGRVNRRCEFNHDREETQNLY